jgi:predicted DNA-binding transcriptional regulator AlpA
MTNLQEASPPSTIHLMSAKQVAAATGMTERWLQLRRTEGDGPKFIRISPKCVRYRLPDVEQWITERTTH